MNYKDEITTSTKIEFSARDRFRILLGRSCHVFVKTKTEHIPGNVISTSQAIVGRLFPKRHGVGFEESVAANKADSADT